MSESSAIEPICEVCGKKVRWQETRAHWDGKTAHTGCYEIAGVLALKDAELDQLRASLRDLLNWVEQLPVKHPQQARARERARLLVHKGKE